MINELLPVVGGLLAGPFLRALPSRLLAPVGTLATLLVAGAATFLSGEYLVSWGFLVFDVPLVALSAGASYLAFGHWKTWSARRLGGAQDAGKAS